MCNTIPATACVFTAPDQPLQPRDVLLPSPAAGQLVVAIELCTICGSDLHTIHGRRGCHGPTVLGHEIVGRVLRLPARAADGTTVADDVISEITGAPLHVGDRITWTIHASCGSCFFCQHGLTAKCDALFKYGHQPIDGQQICTGGFGTHCQLQPGTAIIRLPDDLSNEVACPLNCAVATAAAALRQVGELKDTCCLILGAGMLGLTAAAMAQHAGAKNVVVVDPNPARRQLAESFGATQVADSLAAAEQQVRACTQGRGADVAIEMSGQNQAVLAAVHFLRIGGHAVLVGSVSQTESVPLNPEQLVRRWVTISGVHNYEAKDLAAAVAFMQQAQHQYPFRQLVDKVYPLSELAAAVEHASAGTAIRIGIDPRG